MTKRELLDTICDRIDEMNKSRLSEFEIMKQLAKDGFGLSASQYAFEQYKVYRRRKRGLRDMLIAAITILLLLATAIISMAFLYRDSGEFSFLFATAIVGGLFFFWGMISYLR